MNEYVTIVLEVATDPSRAIDRGRARPGALGQGGAAGRASAVRRSAPDPAEVEAAAREAAQGHPALGHHQRDALTVFFDTSALVKLYVPRAGHRASCAGSMTAPMISELTRVELPSAFWRKHRLGRAQRARRAAVLASEFEADYYGEGGEPRFAVMRISDRTMSMAAAPGGEGGPAGR